jgi:hypothetical protein
VICACVARTGTGSVNPAGIVNVSSVVAASATACLLWIRAIRSTRANSLAMYLDKTLCRSLKGIDRIVSLDKK